VYIGSWYIALMDYKFISGTVSRLRAELNHIGTENRLYFARKNHREDEIVRHREREDRVIAIKLELEGLTTRKIA
jgi:hypothetical protein